jgi:beta-lactamase superfamily II metal-dependent hydrolase
MPVNTNGHLWIYCLNVGQGDTTVVATPGGNVLIFDAVRATKIIRLLDDLGLASDDPIQQIVVSHPHNDHYSGVEGLLNNYTQVIGLTLSSLRRVESTTPSYNSIINTAVRNDVPIHFQSGYTQLYPDQSPIADPDSVLVELLGPSNQFIEDLFQSGDLNTNHYSIIARLNWSGFRMVIAGDAQMESWNHFDSEQMLDDSCSVLRSAHHGSANGTQFERVDRLSPRVIVVSSDPGGKDDIPDLIGSAVFLRYAARADRPLVALTDNQDAVKTGSIKIDVRHSGNFDVFRYGDHKNQNLDLSDETPLNAGNNPTDWRTLTLAKIS